MGTGSRRGRGGWWSNRSGPGIGDATHWLDGRGRCDWETDDDDDDDDGGGEVVWWSECGVERKVEEAPRGLEGDDDDDGAFVVVSCSSTAL